MPAITPFLWFSDNAEEAAKFYVSVFKGGKIITVSHYTAAGPGPVGSVMTVEFQILSQTFTALNGGPMFPFNESVSFVVRCQTQREVDYYWRKLSAGGGRTSQCGWLKDKYGLSWQIVPVALLDLVTGKKKDPVRTARVMSAMMQMTKINLKKIQQAAAATR
eukprot:gene12142-16207_t